MACGRRSGQLPGREPLAGATPCSQSYDEDFAVEFKSTARWDLREGRPNKVMEDGIVKTVAGFLNTDGSTLGIGPNREVVGLDYDYPKVKPPTAPAS